MDSWEIPGVSESDVPDDPGFETFLWYIYRKNKFTDVIFELDTVNESRTFSAHKMVLAMWSPKFEDLFYKGEKQNLVCLKGVNPQAFEDLLRFMYGCEPVLDSHKNAYDLYKVATEFGVASLASLCHKFLLSVDVKVGNVFDILETAKYMQNESLVKRCLNLIQTETKILLSNHKFTDFTPEMIQVMLDLPELSLGSEFELLLWIFMWAKNRYVEQHMYSSVREVLQDFLPLLDFLALSNIEFATLCKHYNNFFSDDEALGIFMNIGIWNSRPMPAWYDTSIKRRTYSGKKL